MFISMQKCIRFLGLLIKILLLGLLQSRKSSSYPHMIYKQLLILFISSGFEHVFMGETKNGQVSGFHGWIHWYLEEQAANVNYLGYIKTVDFGKVISTHIVYRVSSL